MGHSPTYKVQLSPNSQVLCYSCDDSLRFSHMNRTQNAHTDHFTQTGSDPKTCADKTLAPVDYVETYCRKIPISYHIYLSMMLLMHFDHVEYIYVILLSL